VNSSICEKRVNLSDFLNNECVNIYMTWYGLYNFLPGERDADIIDTNYKKGMGCFLFKNQIVSSDNSKNAIRWCDLRLSLQKLCLGLVLVKGYYSDGISAN